MKKIKHEVPVQNWVRNIEQRINSGMTIKEWCQANNIMESRYYYWMKVVRCETIRQTKNGLLPETQNTFVKIQEPSAAEGVVANTRPAATLRWREFETDLTEHASADFIRRLIEGMEKAGLLRSCIQL